MPRSGVRARRSQAGSIAFLDHGRQHRYQSPRQALRAPREMERVQPDQLGHVFDERARQEEHHAHGHPVTPGQRGLGAVHHG